MGTRFWVASDLHLEFLGESERYWSLMVCRWKKQFEIDRPHALILAGDIHFIHIVPRVLKYFWNSFKIPVIFVAGNHEFYQTSGPRFDHPYEAIEKLKEEVGKFYGDIRVLHRDSTTVNNVIIHGCTLWADGKAGTLKDGIADYRMIRCWNQHSMIQSHQCDLEWLQSVLEKCKPSPTVIGAPYYPQIVVTHHMPSLQAIDSKYKDIPNGEFASDLDWVMKSYKPCTWIFGHTHSDFEGYVDNTHLICHPAGYPGEKPQAYKYVPKLFLHK